MAAATSKSGYVAGAIFRVSEIATSVCMPPPNAKATQTRRICEACPTSICRSGVRLGPEPFMTAPKPPAPSIGIEMLTPGFLRVFSNSRTLAATASDSDFDALHTITYGTSFRRVAARGESFPSNFVKFLPQIGRKASCMLEIMTQKSCIMPPRIKGTVALGTTIFYPRFALYRVPHQRLDLLR